MKSPDEIDAEQQLKVIMTRTLARCCIYAGDIARSTGQLAEVLAELAEAFQRKVGDDQPAVEPSEQEAGR